MSENLLQRITLNPDVCHGKPTIRNMRYSVTMVLDLLAAGMTTQEILDDYPAMEEADVRACLAYAARLADVKSIHRVLA